MTYDDAPRNHNKQMSTGAQLVDHHTNNICKLHNVKILMVNGKCATISDEHHETQCQLETNINELNQLEKITDLLLG